MRGSSLPVLALTTTLLGLALGLPLSQPSVGASSLAPAASEASLICLQGDHATLQGILTQLEASPLAAIWRESAVSDLPCVARGFNSSGEADLCFDNVTMHYTPASLPAYPGVPSGDHANLWQYSTIEVGALVSHDFNHHQPNGTAAASVCTRNYIPAATTPAASTLAANPSSAQVGSHVPDAGLLCNEAPLTGEYTIYDMVKHLQGGSLAAIQQSDGVQPVSCAERGFTREQGTVDHCYPPATLWYTGNLFNLYKAGWLETGTMLSYDLDHQAAHGTGLKIAECACRPQSELGRSLPAGFCDNTTAVLPERPSLSLAAPELVQQRSTLGSNSSESGWVMVTAAAPWAARNMASTVTYKEEVFLFGGDNHVDHNYNDVWSTKDGKQWTQLVVDGQAPWEMRSCMPSVVHEGKIRMMGGCHGYTRFNDVWETEDGKSWTRITENAGWSKRCCMPAVVHNGAIVIAGGHDAVGYVNDVWRSVDGVAWTELTAAAAWPIRDGASMVLLGSRMVLLGGHDNHTDDSQWHGDVWDSTDGGSSWNQVAAVADFPARDGAFATVTNNDTVVVMGGFAGYDFYNDMWTSSNGGKHWTKATQTPGWAGRSFFGAAVLPSGGVMVLGGWLSGWGNDNVSVGNGVWVLPAVGNASSF